MLLFLVFLCCYLQRHDDLNYSNVVGDGFFLFLELENELADVGGGLYFVF